jgi:hypothetical protein
MKEGASGAGEEMKSVVKCARLGGRVKWREMGEDLNQSCDRYACEGYMSG